MSFFLRRRSRLYRLASKGREIFEICPEESRLGSLSLLKFEKKRGGYILEMGVSVRGRIGVGQSGLR